MRVSCVSAIEEFSRLRESWNLLGGGIPFRRWEWYDSWWQHYGDGLQLFVLCVHDRTGALIGAAPWCLQHSPWKGRVVRFLGSGEVCSDYQTILCATGRERDVARSLAQWLQAARERGSTRARAWDLLEWTGVGAHDSAMTVLAGELAGRGSRVDQVPAENCWRLEFPVTWDEYLARLSKSHRKQVRRVQRSMLETGRAVLHTVRHPDQFDSAFEILVDLHQRRWQSLGQAGCFSSPRYTAFHRQVARRFLEQGRLRLHWLEIDGRPAAAEYHFTGEGVVFGYQAGVNPELLHEEPGRIAAVATLKAALEEGYRAFDFLCGNEPYKAHWRAAPHPCVRLRVVPRRLAPQLRASLWLLSRSVRGLELPTNLVTAASV